MTQRDVRITLRDRQSTGGVIPSDALFGEPFVNLFDGVLRFSAVTGGVYEPSDQTGVFEVGSKLYNQNISNRLSINNNFIISGGTGIISTYNGASGSGLAGKFLSGTSAGFVLADISSIEGVKTRVQPGVNTYTGGTPDNPTVNVVDSPSFNNILFSGVASGGDVFANSVSATTFYSGSTNLLDIFLTSGDLSGTSVSAGSNITVQNVGTDYHVSVVDSPSFNNIYFSGITSGGSVVATSLSAANLTNTRVLFAGSNGLVTDDAGMTYNQATDVLTVAGSFDTNGTQYSGGTIVDGGIFTIDALTHVEVDSDLLPTNHLSYNLGAIGQRWNLVYARAFRAGISSTEYGDGYITGDTSSFLIDSGDVSINGDVNPSANTVYSLGTNLLRWNNVYSKDIDLTGNLTTTGLTVSGLLPNSVVYVGSDNKLKTEAEFYYDENIDTLVSRNLQIGNGSLSGNVTIFGDLTVVGSPISAFTSQLYIEDNNIILNYNPTATTQQYSLGAGFTVQDGSGIAGTDVYFDIRGTATGLSDRYFTTNLSNIILSQTGTTSSPSGLFVLKEYDILHGGNY